MKANIAFDGDGAVELLIYASSRGYRVGEARKLLSFGSPSRGTDSKGIGGVWG